MRSRLYRTIATATFACLALAVAGCGGDGGDDPETLPSESTTSSSPSSTPTPSTPAWESKYTDKQLEWYREALGRWTTYEQRSEPIWATGKATPAAEQLFKEFFVNPDAQFQTLQTYEQGQIKTKGTPEVSWSRAASVSSSKNTGTHATTVTVRQCVDYRTRVVTAMGKPSELDKKFRRPLIREISMTRLATTWLISGVDDLSDGKAKPCDPT